MSRLQRSQTFLLFAVPIFGDQTHGTTGWELYKCEFIYICCMLYPICGVEAWCDGEWDIEIASLARSGQKCNDSSHVSNKSNQSLGEHTGDKILHGCIPLKHFRICGIEGLKHIHTMPCMEAVTNLIDSTILTHKRKAKGIRQTKKRSRSRPNQSQTLISSAPTGGSLAAILHFLNNLTSPSARAPTTECKTPWLLNRTKSPSSQSCAYTNSGRIPGR